jgi:hypothetical protein
LEDRDYMRERRRAEARLGSVSWIDRQGRVEHSGLWFGAGERGFDSRRGRYRWRGSHSARSAQLLIWLLSALLVIVPMIGAAKRGGWLPDPEPGTPFPASGSVTVSRSLDFARLKSWLEIRTDEANAVVQLYRLRGDRHVLSIYAGKRDRVRVPVPTGTFRIRLIEGQKWHGGLRFFGPNTSYETVVQAMSFTESSGQIIDLHRRPDGNLPTRMMIAGPDPL